MRRAFLLVVESLVGLIVLEGSCFCDHSSQGCPVAASNPARRAREKVDELGAPHSITSSARASSTGGTSEGKRLSGQAVVMSG